jgi:hypothetical protein
VGGGETFGGGTEGGGGRGELACRFSGFGDPTTATELAALEDEAETDWVHILSDTRLILSKCFKVKHVKQKSCSMLICQKIGRDINEK